VREIVVEVVVVLFSKEIPEEGRQNKQTGPFQSVL